MVQGSGIEQLIGPTVESMGFGLVRVRLLGGNTQTLQIMIERLGSAARNELGDGGISADDCAEVSRAVSAILDVEDPVAGAYVLEVSSPGIDRPLTRLNDFSRFAGHELRLEMRAPIDGRKRFKGNLRGTDGDRVLLALDTGEVAIPYDNIFTAKLVLTDALLEQAAHAAERQQAANNERM